MRLINDLGFKQIAGMMHLISLHQMCIFKSFLKFKEHPWSSTKWQLLLPLLSQISHVQIFAALWIVAHQAPLSMGFSRQQYWTRLPWSPPGDLPNPGTESRSLTSPALWVDSLLLSRRGSPKYYYPALMFAVPAQPRNKLNWNKHNHLPGQTLNSQYLK